jgi:glucuronate isomerase
MDHEKGWTQQFHVGAIRNNSTRLRLLAGADCGADSIGDHSLARSMSDFFDRLDREQSLTKTIVYNLNPADSEVVATMLGNYNDGIIPGKMQYGSAWWFLDQKDGIEKQINVLSNMGLLSRFVGMLTDSRSFVSYPRHEYFRRILCDLVGRDVEDGLIPESEMKRVEDMIEDICYRNAERFFNF